MNRGLNIPLEETIVIANELGINHPTDLKTGSPIVMTTDFLLTVQKGQNVTEVARTIKMKDELPKKHVLEKFEIEREFWQRKDIDWIIVTEEEISKTMARNIGYIHDYYDIRDYDVFQEMSLLHIVDLSLSLMQRLLNNKQNILTGKNSYKIGTYIVPLTGALTE
ncbi:TnsA endonuclease N-terminal domain-containing protein [Pseudogracilibacillus sp. SO30301A]|uniref:TnsA endonuclease N-terminal domain-containing protein n=1 Tax=Pseudogracilibacillus sp. SO30301A TaxID=3098291 RepID=UPI003FA6C746